MSAGTMLISVVDGLLPELGPVRFVPPLLSLLAPVEPLIVTEPEFGALKVTAQETCAPLANVAGSGFGVQTTAGLPGNDDALVIVHSC